MINNSFKTLKKLNIPKIGLRNIKTSISVVACLFLFRIINRPHPLYACIAAIICTKDTVHNSFEIAKERLIGTMIGGVIGGLFLQVNDKVDFWGSYEIVIGLGIVIVIYCCNLINKKGATSISCVVFLFVLTNFIDSPSHSPFTYALSRTLDTAIGIILSLIINKYFFPLNVDEKEES
ncbi:putative membrane protein [Gottschalkia purinilytica]|uniref:Putative membrane protein n=1 Tax=Gottschalkia purinilytica TaxID=1503 RepID=A0A0L0WEK2_GOTPU|nr:aromatic acid exporter family protein [Gottschalkia purinilytica]KNF09866.1 putative membrane protein [Gottschalkia purinilytica]